MDSRRITLVADELRGLQGGGLGTATTYLAVSLGRVGHEVEVLYVGEAPGAPVTPEWSALYESAGVSIRSLARSREAVEPSFFGRMLDVEQALRTGPPDVVITQDLGAPAYAALRRRELGLGFESTAFVVFCHGTRQWITDMARKVHVLPGALGVGLLEQASVELADVVVSPSAYLREWMQRQGWRLPERTATIPYVTCLGATGEDRRERPTPATEIERIVFFGRLEERKGIRPFLAGVDALEPELLGRIGLEFVGKATPAWPPARVKAELSDSVLQALRGLSFQTDLDQPQALERLARPGTLAVMPSLEDNSPNTVYECLERGIPFLASRRGGTEELVAAADRARVLFEPTAEGIEAALRGALTGEQGPRPARPAFDPAASLSAWEEVVAMRPRRRRQVRLEERPALDVVLSAGGDPQALGRCLRALAAQSYPAFRVLLVHALGEEPGLACPEGLELVQVACESGSKEALREAGLAAGSAPFVVFLEEADLPFPELLETLVRAQQASAADACSCGFYLEEGGPERTLCLFAGEPRGLGLVANGYGQVALLRRSALPELRFAWPVEEDPDWPLLARLSASGAKIVSVPIPLLTRARRPGTIERQPADALLVVFELERTLPEQARSLTRLAGGLAASAASAPAPAGNGSLSSRAGRVYREQGLSGLARRTGERLRRRIAGGGK